MATAAPTADIASVRTMFSTTPFFSGHVRTDSLGHAATTFTLPDNVSAFRIFAAAVGTGLAAGSGDTSVISTRDMVVRAALPRVVRVGDELFAGAVLTKESTGRVPVSLSVMARNATVTGSQTLRDTLDGQRAREIRFPMRITGGDTATFVFRGTTLSGEKMSDAVEARLAISPPGRARAHVATGMVEQVGDVRLEMPEGTDTARSRVSLQLGVSALPLVRQFSEALRVYPYYCTEQVSSAGRGLLARIALDRAINDSAVISPKDRAQLELAVATLTGRQREDGGFGYWTLATWTSPWLTVYALEFLMGARDVGIDVPESVIARARVYAAATRTQHRQMRTDPEFAWRDSLTWPHDALAAAGLLRRIGLPDTTLERQVWDLRERLGFEDRLSLANLSAAIGDSARALRLLDAAWKSAHLEGRRVVLDDSAASRSWLFRSTSRPVALLLGATARLQPRHPLLGALFESLVQSGHSESSRWWNT
ncbi:MAG: alpha-2-macroglobulin domain protein 2, partial [Gemmatimonadetes bacterium]|nr:alpha-2-macroglobulin domain protein 2 [Gemmatimonadota bacterium]